VLALIAEGRTGRQIAGPLFISPPDRRHARAQHPARIGVTSRGG